MDLETMRARLRTRLGVPDSDALYTDDVCNQLINAALHYNETEAAWGWLETEGSVNTADGTSTYALPTGFRAAITLTSPDGFPLERATAEHHRLLSGASGVPKVWDIFGTLLRLAPTPTSVLVHQLVYIGAEPDLELDNDEPLIPAVWHDAIIEYAAYLGFRRWGAAAESGSALAAYETWLEQMLKQAPRYSLSTGGGTEPVATPPAEAS